MNEVVRVLKEGRGIIANPSTFCTRAYARDKGGNSIHFNSEEAVRWCSYGALMKVTGGETSELFDQARFYIVKELQMPLALFNDTRPHEKVVKMWDRAIEQAVKAQV